MVKLGYLFDTEQVEDENLLKTKASINESIDELMERGTKVNKDTLLIMKELLKNTKPSLSDFADKE